jgi:hypothetical protein
LHRILQKQDQTCLGYGQRAASALGSGRVPAPFPFPGVAETRSRLSVPVDAMATMGARGQNNRANQAAANPSSSHACPVKNRWFGAYAAACNILVTMTLKFLGNSASLFAAHL